MREQVKEVSSSHGVGENAPTAVRGLFVGPNMDLAKAAYQRHHDQFGHQIRYVRRVAEVGRMNLIPDFVVINPLVITTEGIDGACALQSVVPDSTLIVVFYTSLGSSHSMYTKHALEGYCHPRMLLHYPDPSIAAGDVVREIDSLVRGKGGGPQIRTTGHLPEELHLRHAASGLGQIICADEGRPGESNLTFAKLLVAAASGSDWATWRDLANVLNFGEGHVKNTKARLGRVLVEANLPNKPSGLRVAENGTKAPWRIAEFVRFVIEHRSFIRAFCEHHVGVPSGELGDDVDVLAS